MSAIRPGLPSFPAPLQPAGQAPLRAARSDFFKAALDAVQAGGAEPAARPAVPGSTATTQEIRLPRPGALLDIRV
jgi:hypothetical protein